MILRTIHVGVSGAGTWALEAVSKDPRFKPVALVDANPVAMKMAQLDLKAAGHAGVTSFSGITGALSQVQADALILCTPTRTHAETARMAFSVNMHVLVEPAMTSDYKDARQLVADADAAWVKLCVAQQHRYRAAERTITSILNNPAHIYHPGDVKMADVVAHHTAWSNPPLDYAGSAVWECASHHIDSLSAWLGPVKRLHARSYAAPWTQYVYESNFSAFIEYATGAMCNYVLTHDATAAQQRITLQGAKGALVLTDNQHLQFLGKPDAHNAIIEAVNVPLLDVPAAGASILDDFQRQIIENVEPAISGRNNLNTLAVCEMLLQSARGKRLIERSEI